MPEQPITPKTFARILSRAFSLYLLVWALSDLLVLPEDLPSFLHHFQMPADSPQRSYWLTYYGMRLAINILRAVALLVFSRYLWKNGTFLLTFFPEDPANSSDTSTQES